MTNTFLIFTDFYGDILRVRADAISSYKNHGIHSMLTIDGLEIAVQHTAEDIDKALTESYVMLKPVVKSE